MKELSPLPVYIHIDLKTEFRALKKYNHSLHCVINYTEEYALQQAALLDKELSEGKDRGILHGIPYGIKDLFS